MDSKLDPDFQKKEGSGLSEMVDPIPKFIVLVENSFFIKFESTNFKYYNNSFSKWKPKNIQTRWKPKNIQTRHFCLKYKAFSFAWIFAIWQILNWRFKICKSFSLKIPKYDTFFCFARNFGFEEIWGCWFQIMQ